MRCSVLISLSISGLLGGSFVLAKSVNETSTSTLSWNQQAAARYLDNRQGWWEGWSKSQRDHGTVCISCHTALPYALSRPILRNALGEHDLTPTEQVMLASVTKRVTLWNEVQPVYTDEKQGPPKSAESRGTESVLNALVLVNYDASRGSLNDITRRAFDAAWALQLKTGEKAGAWTWLNFHNSPWEADESQYYGAALAAIAVGMAPGHYLKDHKIQQNVKLLRSYLRREYPSQPLVNQVVLLWASSKVPGLLNKSQKQDLMAELFRRQQADGGWSLSTLGTFKRRDKTAEDARSDGYATGLTVYALQQAGLSRNKPEVQTAILWLERNQNPTDGLWPGYSLNKQRDPNTDVGKFMSDAATGYAVLALENSRRSK
jgi:squalene-hopene/tetraprenyl-beta-curcumene cyclase